MKKIKIAILSLLVAIGCTNKERSSSNESAGLDNQTEMLVDSLLYFRHHNQETGILSRKLPNITREKAIDIQLGMLKKELNGGATQIGWKMGGTVTDDSAEYDPMFGYMLESHSFEEDDPVLVDNFPGGNVMIEGEIGFVLNKDFEDGVQSMEALKEGIDHVVNAVEFAKSIAIPIQDDPETSNINHVLASGMGHAGIMLGSGKMDVESFDMKNETVKCYIDGELAAEGVSSNVYGGPLNALYSLANMLPEYGTYLKKGDIVVTGSVYDNPTVNSAAEIRLEFSNLGTINFNME